MYIYSNIKCLMIVLYAIIDTKDMLSKMTVGSTLGSHLGMLVFLKVLVN